MNFPLINYQYMKPDTTYSVVWDGVQYKSIWSNSLNGYDLRFLNGPASVGDSISFKLVIETPFPVSANNQPALQLWVNGTVVFSQDLTVAGEFIYNHLLDASDLNGGSTLYLLLSVNGAPDNLSSICKFSIVPITDVTPEEVWTDITGCDQS